MKKNFLFVLFLLSTTVSGEPPSDSIFWLKSEWIKEDGTKIQLSDLQKTPFILSMVFLGCKYSCPLTIQDMREMDSKLQKESKKPYRMVLISIDPDRDTPKAMQKFMGERKLDPARWIILSSSPENIRELAAALGFNYKKAEAMEFSHSMLTWIFDEQGVKRFTRSARKETIDEIVKAMEKVLRHG